MLVEELLMDLLDRHVATQFEVASAIDGGITPGTNLFQNLITRMRLHSKRLLRHTIATNDSPIRDGGRDESSGVL